MVQRLWFGALMIGVLVTAPALAQQRNDPSGTRQQRQDSLRMTLTTDRLEVVRRVRMSCAGGKEPHSIAMARKAGFYMTPDAVDRCPVALTRLGRDGALGYVQDTVHGATPAMRFDTGFVTAYRRREALPANLPTILALRPLVDRCLTGTEADADRCYSAGYVFGLRAAQGELPVAQ